MTTNIHPSLFDPPPLDPPVLTSVQACGITVDPLLADSDSQIRRFHRHASERAHLREVLPLINTTPKGKMRFIECGARAAVEFDAESSRFKIRARTCGHRWCPACRQAFVHDLRAKINLATLSAPRFGIKFITLTIRSKSSPLRSEVDFLWKSFRRLRQTELWKRRCKWGVAVLEITYNHKQNQWHPHIHIICESGFMPQKALARTWEKASQGSRVCDIRAVKNTSQAVAYITKYATKGTLDDSAMHDELLTAELLNSLKRMKTVLWFGNKPQPQEDSENEKESGEKPRWQHVCSLDHLIDLAKKGDQHALDIIKAIDTGERGPPPQERICYRKDL